MDEGGERDGATVEADQEVAMLSTAIASAHRTGRPDALVDAVADALEERAPEGRAAVARALQVLGWRTALRLLLRTQLIEAAGGIWSATEKRRRTKGGVFFSLMTTRARRRMYALVPRQTAQDQAPADPLQWPECRSTVHQARLARGEVQMVPKMTLIGRPALEGVVHRDSFVVFSLDFRGAPSLPKGLPKPPDGPTTYTLFVAAKKWPPVLAALIADPADQIVAEGFPAFDPEIEGPVLFVQSATTRALQRTKRDEGAGKAEVPIPAPRAAASAGTNAEAAGLPSARKIEVGGAVASDRITVVGGPRRRVIDL